MRPGTRARIGLFVSLGILAGIGFIGLPGLILGAPHPVTAPRSNGSNSTSSYGADTALGSTPVNSRGNASTTQQTPAGDQPVSLGSLGRLVSLVIVPATAIALVGSLFVARRSRKSSTRIQSDQV